MAKRQSIQGSESTRNSLREYESSRLESLRRRRWKETINIHGVLDNANAKHDLSRVEEPCPGNVKEELAREVEKSTALKTFAPRIRNAKSIAAVNRVLNKVFNAADANLVWVGMPS